MILGSLETLCLSIFVLLLIMLVALITMGLLRMPRTIPGHFLSPGEAPPLTLDTVFKLNHYFPLPAGYAYLEEEGEGSPIIVRIDDGLQLSYRLEEKVLIFEEPFVRADGTSGVRTHEVFRQHPAHF